MNVLRTVALAAGLCLAPSLAADETDPYSQRHVALNDSTRVMNAHVNAALERVVERWQWGENEWRFVQAVFGQLGGLFRTDRMEKWTRYSGSVELLNYPESVFSDAPVVGKRMVTFAGVAPIFKVNGVMVGVDKIGHFFSQGRKYYRRYLKHGEEAFAARRSFETERGIFGLFSTGVFSNADLVANYEGYLFYRSLFHEDAVGRPMLAWNDGRPERLRDFDWADHVNAFWDEGINPNRYSRTLLPYIQAKLLEFCEPFLEDPAIYSPVDREALYARYRHIHVGPSPDDFDARGYLEDNCGVPASTGTAVTSAGGGG